MTVRDRSAIHVLRLDNPAMQVEFATDLGGKIAQIVDQHMGRKWLAHHPRLAWRLPDDPDAPDAYVRLGDLGGWDECCPTVAPSTYPLPPFAGRSLPDHGECWYRRPDERRDGLTVEHRWRGASLPFELRRILTLDPDEPRITLDYALRSFANTPISLLWSAHPLIAIEPGMRLDLPHGTRVAVASAGSPLGLAGRRLEWPLCESIDLSVVTPRAGWAAKLFTEVMDPGAVALVAAKGDALRLSWSSGDSGTGSLVRLGIWLNYMGWSGDGGPPLCNIGLEPCIGMPDALNEAIAAGTALVLNPGEERRWPVRVDCVGRE